MGDAPLAETTTLLPYLDQEKEKLDTVVTEEAENFNKKATDIEGNG